MKLSLVLFSIFQFLIYPAIVISALLYLYPLFFGCTFPSPSSSLSASQGKPNTCYFDAGQKADGQDDTTPQPPPLPDLAPFRLLVFGDPQLEGDTSLPDPSAPTFPSLQSLRHLKPSYQPDDLRTNLDHLKAIARALLDQDIPLFLRASRKRLDLLGNDFYLAHIYRTLHWWLRPTHVAVLGDLLGSQWIADEEFTRRTDRFWNRVFRRGRKVEDALTNNFGGTSEVLGEDSAWKDRVITVAGNHDVGYAGDMTSERLARFERSFGPSNWSVKFTLPGHDNSTATTIPELHLIALNSMNLDGPAFAPHLQQQTYDFINSRLLPSNAANAPVSDPSSATLLLTHIPLFKRYGVCVDGPYFAYHDELYGAGVAEQNHLSRAASAPILEGVFAKNGNPLVDGAGLGRDGLVLAGHDHEGCDVFHYIPHDVPRDGAEWHAERWEDARAARQDPDVPGLREVTLRSMMGSYGGNAGMLSAWFDEAEGRWRFEVEMCAAGAQHFWWAVHVFDLVALLFLVGSVVAFLVEGRGVPRVKSGEGAALQTPKAKGVNGPARGTGVDLGSGSVKRRSGSKSLGREGAGVTPRGRRSVSRRFDEF